MNRSIFLIKLISIFFLAAASFSSCLVSSRSDVAVFNKNEYASTVLVKTIRVPMFIGKPIIKRYLRFEENVPGEIVNLISGIKKVRVTLAETTNPKLVTDFRTSINGLSGEEWLSVHNGLQWVYLKADQNDQGVIKRITVSISAPEANQLVYVNVKCNLTPDQLSKLINYTMESEEGKSFFEGTGKRLKNPDN
ncbi:MAG TPA: hypothetical protein VGB63_16580 [Pedobacter sp.]